MKSIRLNNYRCFEELYLEFKPGVNLLVGDNASGKTTILKALRTALGAFFYGYSDENTRTLGLSKYDFTEIQTETSIINDRPVSVSFNYSDHIEYENIIARQDSIFPETTTAIGILRLNSKKSSRTSIADIKYYKDYAKALQESLFDQAELKQIKALPLFASFSTEDIHSSRNVNSQKFKSYVHKPSFGYYECLKGDSFFPYWIKRMLVLAEGNKGELEINGVRSAIKHALGLRGCNIIDDFSIRPMKGRVYYHFVDGREVGADNLSDGYVRLANIVTDIAFRCMLLNQGIYGMDSCKKTRGTVLIDEIDLHLHPTLQSLVVKSLKRAFPKIQFIITTHAPMVMTSIESNNDNQIYYLSYSKDDGYQAKPIQVYGMDASTIIDVSLKQTPRDKQVQEQLDHLFELIDNDEINEAKDKLKFMREQFHDNLPELTKAETMLNFMCGKEDEEDN